MSSFKEAPAVNYTFRLSSTSFLLQNSWRHQHWYPPPISPCVKLARRLDAMTICPRTMCSSVLFVIWRCVPDWCVPTLESRKAVDNHNSCTRNSDYHGCSACHPQGNPGFGHLAETWTASSMPALWPLESRPNLSRHGIPPPPPHPKGMNCIGTQRPRT